MRQGLKFIRPTPCFEKFHSLQALLLRRGPPKGTLKHHSDFFVRVMLSISHLLTPPFCELHDLRVVEEGQRLSRNCGAIPFSNSREGLGGVECRKQSGQIIAALL